jgi:uncharacterized protein YegJ (DUF2314 family)
MAIQIISIVIVLVIVVFFLRKENRKEKEYFGEKVKPDRKAKKILEKYKQEYEPIRADARLTTLHKDKWELEDIAKSATEIIYSAAVPARSERQNLKPGDLVKLHFLIEEDDVTETERMWVQVTGERDGLFSGTLDNDPFNEILKAGQLIWFHSNHVSQIDRYNH